MMVVFMANFFGLTSFVWLLVVPLIICLMSLFTIVRWVDRFASGAFDDEDLTTAFRKVRGAFWIWLAVTVAQIGGLLTLVRTG